MTKIDDALDEFYASTDWRDERFDSVKLDDFIAYLPEARYIFKPTGALWPARGVNARLPNVGDHKPSAWLDAHARVEQMTWAPGQPQLIEDRLFSEEGEWIEKPGCTTFNLYRPSIIEIGDAAKADPWVDLVHKLYPDDAEHILDYFAQRRQRPWDKINHMLMLGGAPGIGKDSIITAVSRAAKRDRVDHRVARSGDSNRVMFYEASKLMLASPPASLRVNEKHVKPYYIPNVCGVVATTNYKTDALYLAADDRRHYIAWSNKGTAWRTKKGWIKYHQWLDAGGDRHVAAFLQERNLSQFNAKAPPKKTAAFWEIVSASQLPEESELADVVDKLDGRAVTIGDVISEAHSLEYDGLAEFFRDRTKRRILAGRLDKAGYVPIDNPDAKDRLWKINGKRCAIYYPKRLSRREAMELVQERLAERSDDDENVLHFRSRREFRKRWER
jgi:hypothetical protein